MIHPYEWWEERIEIARMESETPGARSFFGACPVHGGSDSFHVTEKNGKAQVHCFGCEAKYQDVIDALDTELEADSEASQASESEAPQLVVVRRASQPSAGSALDWCAQRTGQDRALIDRLVAEGHLSDLGDRVAFEFGNGIRKTRGLTDGKKKDITWEGPTTAPLWPVPDAPGKTITLTEGEFDAIALMGNSAYEPYSITGGAGSLPRLSVFLELKSLGVERIIVCFDDDDAGRKAQSSIIEIIRTAGIIGLSGRPDGLQPLYGEKDIRDVAVRLGTVEIVSHPETELDVQALEDVEPADDAELLLGRLDPDDHTILFGDGGAGKGMIAAWWASCMTRGREVDEDTKVEHAEKKKTILILDYEAHAETEWRKRVEAFRGDLSRVHVVSPRASIWDIAGPVAELIKEMRIDYVIVDSAIYACAGSDAYTPEAATKYSLAISQFGKPVLTLAHKTKSKDDQDKPFGSVFWHNGARLTISVEAKDYDDPREIHTRKANHGADFHRSIDWSWVRDGLPGRLDEEDTEMSMREVHDQVHDELLASLGKPPTPLQCFKEAQRQGLRLSEASSKKQHRLAPIAVVMASTKGSA